MMPMPTAEERAERDRIHASLDAIAAKLREGEAAQSE
jgi:hypothetical protein